MATYEIYINMPGFMKSIAKQVTASIAIDARNRARNKVRIDTGALKNSINVEQIDEQSWEAFTNMVYAAAQEFGLAEFGKPGYGFTPYMRPAAMEASAPSNINKIVQNAVNKAHRENMT